MYNPFLEADLDLVCQPGARWMDINDTLKEKGMPFAIAPVYIRLIFPDIVVIGIPLFFSLGPHQHLYSSSNV
jgi:FAD/FMN-containing dehydrogenase